MPAAALGEGEGEEAGAAEEELAVPALGEVGIPVELRLGRLGARAVE